MYGVGVTPLLPFSPCATARRPPRVPSVTPPAPPLIVCELFLGGVSLFSGGLIMFKAEEWMCFIFREAFLTLKPHECGFLFTSRETFSIRRQNNIDAKLSRVLKASYNWTNFVISRAM